jgi:hypothetical protein
MIWGCRSPGHWLQAADLRAASGSLGGEDVGRLHGEPCACGSHAGLFEADSEVGADPGMTVQHAAQRHTRDAETWGGLADAEANLNEHVLAEISPGWTGFFSSRSGRSIT